jgi:hypothetical protein
MAVHLLALLGLMFSLECGVGEGAVGSWRAVMTDAMVGLALVLGSQLIGGHRLEQVVCFGPTTTANDDKVHGPHFTKATTPRN